MSINSPSYNVTDQDREFFERELASFVPDSLFDSHIHLGLRSDCAEFHQTLMANTPEVADMPTYRTQMDWIARGREVVGALVLPTTLEGKRMAEGNACAAREARTDHASTSAVMVHPAMSADQLRADIEQHDPAALKPYHLMSARRPTGESYMDEFLPEHTVAVADEFGLPIVMHMVRARALADESNQRFIREYCTRYPNMKMVLAHCARGFNPSHTMGGIDAIAGLDNVYFDNSCNCEEGGHIAILRRFGPKKLMWGSDYPFSHLRGKCVAVNDSFTWMYDCDYELGPTSIDPNQQFTLVGLESMRALKFACQACGVTDSQVEDIFRNNAARLYGRG
tara:strand:+ start:412 stop:1425 length:1014 start_codon:yes stop_codon:yes gene_type:complete